MLGLAYLLISIVSSLWGVSKYKRFLNPISIYSIVMGSSVMLYDSGLIMYFGLTSITFFVLVIFHCAFIMGSYFGMKTNFIKTKIHNQQYNKKYTLLVIIIITSISGFVIINNYLQYVKIFGYNLIYISNELYAYRMSGQVPNNVIPYLSSLVYIAIIMASIYTIKHGFKLVFLVPIILAIVEELTSGGRLAFITVPLMFFAIFTTKKVRLKTVILLALLASISLPAFLIISDQRTSGLSNEFSSKFLSRLTSNNETIYKILEYFTSPVGTLNEYLKEPTVSFGKNTLLPIYNVASKLGFDIDVNIYQDVYFVPMPVNVGTFARELIEDFGLFFATVVTILFAYTTSFYLNKFKKDGSYSAAFIYSTSIYIVCFFFFDWRLRSSSVWIILLVGFPITLAIDNFAAKSKNTLKKLQNKEGKLLK